MKVCDLTYQEALERNPTEVKSILVKLRKGKSKHKKASPSKLAWSYECGVLIEGSGSFADMLNGKMAQKRAEFEALSIDERVADQVRRTSTSLEARIGRWSGSERVANPPEVAQNARANFEQQERERQEYEALPPEEKSVSLMKRRQPSLRVVACAFRSETILRVDLVLTYRTSL
ncbi:MAG TPA: hypothetical protein VMW91_02940 [Desulfosporosinus sp.]|nr:hypothetical protein [Desulfosporosinus sp.]